ncbi:rpS17 protein [Guillardia theta]|uniref:RpS17 protein n=1 Tax=Guillardia theta TaxID=55529 RepID=Q9AW27_GUITH|nr:rpS17 protein [Guillardia theta]CAC27044.1 rpS17 protein [Guillardia theta]
MGKVRTKTIKRSAKYIFIKYFKHLTIDFQENKFFCDEIALITSKSLRNKIAGYVTHLIKEFFKGKKKKIYTNIKFDINNIEINNKESEVFSNTELKLNLVDDETKQMIKKLFPNKNII